MTQLRQDRDTYEDRDTARQDGTTQKLRVVTKSEKKGRKQVMEKLAIFLSKYLPVSKESGNFAK